MRGISITGRRPETRLSAATRTAARVEAEPAVALDGWAGGENLEGRVDGADAVDPVVLEALREASS